MPRHCWRPKPPLLYHQRDGRRVQASQAVHRSVLVSARWLSSLSQTSSCLVLCSGFGRLRHATAAAASTQAASAALASAAHASAASAAHAALMANVTSAAAAQAVSHAAYAAALPATQAAPHLPAAQWSLSLSHTSSCPPLRYSFQYAKHRACCSFGAIVASRSPSVASRRSLSKLLVQPRVVRRPSASEWGALHPTSCYLRPSAASRRSLLEQRLSRGGCGAGTRRRQRRRRKRRRPRRRLRHRRLRHQQRLRRWRGMRLRLRRHRLLRTRRMRRRPLPAARWSLSLSRRRADSR